MRVELDARFEEALSPFGEEGTRFLLAASLYHAGRVSFARAAALANLSQEAFHERLRAHFGHGLRLTDELVREDLRASEDLPG